MRKGSISYRQGEGFGHDLRLTGRPSFARVPEPATIGDTQEVQTLNDKSKGVVVNKAAEIRRVANVLVAEGEIPRPKTIRERLGRHGLTVTSQQVSMALTNTEFAYRRNKVDQRRPRLPMPDLAESIRGVNLEELAQAKTFIGLMGGPEKAIRAVVAASHIADPPTRENNTGAHCEGAENPALQPQ